MDEDGKRLSSYDMQIVNYIRQLKEQRDDCLTIIESQKKEKQELEGELEKIVYKLKMIEKSMTQRVHALESYENKILLAEEKYGRIVQHSESLLSLVKSDLQELENFMDKKIGTNPNED